MADRASRCFHSGCTSRTCRTGVVAVFGGTFYAAVACRKHADALPGHTNRMVPPGTQRLHTTSSDSIRRPRSLAQAEALFAEFRAEVARINALREEVTRG